MGNKRHSRAREPKTHICAHGQIRANSLLHQIETGIVRACTIQFNLKIASFACKGA